MSISDLNDYFSKINKDGYCIIKNIFSSKFCNDCIDYLKNDLKNNNTCIRQTTIPYLYTNFDPDSIIYSILKNDIIQKIIEKKLGKNYKLLWFKIFNKNKWIGQDVEYHQEIIYNRNSNININDSFQLFLALDKHNLDNGCLKIIPFNEKYILEYDEFIDRHGDHKYRIKNELLDKLYKDNGIINCIFEPGDCIFFDDPIPHGSSSNSSPLDRYGVSISFIKSDVKIDIKQRELSYSNKKDKSKKYLYDVYHKNNNKLSTNIFVNI